MKRGIALLAAVLSVAVLAACSQNAKKDDTSSDNYRASFYEDDPYYSTPQNGMEVARPVSIHADSNFVPTSRGIPIPMNSDFSVPYGLLGEPDSYFEAASCAFSGLDKTFTYANFEVVTYPDGDTDRVSSVRFLSGDISTIEGVSIGSSRDDVVDAYGDGYEEAGSAYDYIDGDTTLEFIFDGDTVSSIEYVADNPLLK